MLQPRTSLSHTTTLITLRTKWINTLIFLLYQMQLILFSTRIIWQMLMVLRMDLFILMTEWVFKAMRNNLELILFIKLKIKIKFKLYSINWIICTWMAQWMNMSEILQYLVHTRIKLSCHFHRCNCSQYRNQLNQ